MATHSPMPTGFPKRMRSAKEIQTQTDLQRCWHSEKRFPTPTGFQMDLR